MILNEFILMFIELYIYIYRLLLYQIASVGVSVLIIYITACTNTDINTYGTQHLNIVF